MDPLIAAALFLAFGGGAAALCLLAKRYLDARLAPAPDVTVALTGVQQSLQTQMNALDVRLDARLNGLERLVGDSLRHNSVNMQEVGERLGELSAATTRMLRVGEDIASLQEILQPPKLRGGLGELSLKHLLEQVLPPALWAEQHRFRDGRTVDFIIRVGDGLVPVDAKFPLESFTRLLASASDGDRAACRKAFCRAVRGHIDDVSRYVLPAEGTFEFAIMYVPAENVCYEMLVNDGSAPGEGLQEYALARRVFPVSPNSFYAYLMVLVHGLRGLRIEKRAQEISNHLTGLTQDFARLEKELDTLGRHLGQAGTKYQEVDRLLERFGDRLALPVSAPDGETPMSAELPSSD